MVTTPAKPPIVSATTLSTSKESRDAELEELRKKKLTWTQSHDFKNVVQAARGQPIPMDKWFSRQKEESEITRRQKQDATQNLRSYRPQRLDQDTTNFKEELRKQELEATQLLRNYRCQPEAFLPHQAGNTPEMVSAIVNAAHKGSSTVEIPLLPVKTAELSNPSQYNGVSSEKTDKIPEKKEEIAFNSSTSNPDEKSIRKSSSGSDWSVLSEKFDQKENKILVDPSLLVIQSNVDANSTIIPQLLQTDHRKEIQSDSSYIMPSHEEDGASEKKSLGGSTDSYVFANDDLAGSTHTIETDFEANKKQSRPGIDLDENLESNTDDGRELSSQLDSLDDEDLAADGSSVQTVEAADIVSQNELSMPVQEEILENADNTVESLKSSRKDIEIERTVHNIEAADIVGQNELCIPVKEKTLEDAENIVHSLKPLKIENKIEPIHVADKNEDVDIESKIKSNTDNGRELSSQLDSFDDEDFVAVVSNVQTLEAADIVSQNELSMPVQEEILENTDNAVESLESLGEDIEIERIVQTIEAADIVGQNELCIPVKEETLEDAENIIHSLKPLKDVTQIEPIHVAAKTVDVDIESKIEPNTSGDATVKAEEEAARLQVEEESRIIHEAAKVVAIEAERIKVEEEVRIKAEAARSQAEEEARIAAEEKAKAIAVAAEAEQIKIEEEARVKAEVEAARLQAEEEARVIAEVARLASIEAERIKAEEEVRIKAEAARSQVEEEARIAAEEEAQATVAVHMDSLLSNPCLESHDDSISDLRHMISTISISVKFGLLTMNDDDIPIGFVQGPFECALLDTLVCKIEKLAIQSLVVERKANNMTVGPEKTAIFLSIENDASYQAPLNRPGILRHFVKAKIQVEICSDDVQAAKKKVRVALERAVSSGSLNVVP